MKRVILKSSDKSAGKFSIPQIKISSRDLRMPCIHRTELVIEKAMWVFHKAMGR